MTTTRTMQIKAEIRSASRDADSPSWGVGGRRAHSEVEVSYFQYSTGEPWTPAINLYEDDENYYVAADLAGVGCESIEIESATKSLTIHGHRPTPPPPDVHGKIKVLHMEIDHGDFRRVLELPSDVESDRIEAVYRTGQLLVTLPKKRT